MRKLLAAPELLVKIWLAARTTDNTISESEVREALSAFEPLWNELFPAEQARVVQLLVERVDVATDGVKIRLRVEGLNSLISELRSTHPLLEAA